ncbi:MAG: ATP-binding protein [Gemmatimonadaceae bacterium]
MTSFVTGERLQSVRLDGGGVGVRELMAVREIAQAFLTAERPGEVFQLALDRVAPIVGSTFACIYLVDESSEVMRLQAVHNWPERYSAFLGDMRVRLGSGPSGSAARERRIIEVPDVFADATLADWQEVAAELGFKALVALPLQTPTGVLGAVTFYFASSASLTGEARGLLRLVADQLAATAEKSRLIEDLTRANAALQTGNVELERQYAAVVEARRLQDEFMSNLSHELRTPLTAVMGYLSLMEEGLGGPITDEQRRTIVEMKASSEKLLHMIGDLLELTALKRNDIPCQITEFDPREPLRAAIKATNGRKAGVELIVEEGAQPPRMRSDIRKVARLLAALLNNAFKFTERGEVRVSVRSTGTAIVYRLADTGVGISAAAQRFVFEEFRQEDGSATRRYGGSGLGLALARRLATILGGDIRLSSERSKGSIFEVELPLVMEPPHRHATTHSPGTPHDDRAG